MTRKERALAAIRREPVDRVPHATYNLHPYGATAHSKDPSYAPLLKMVRADACAFIKAGIGGIEVGLTRWREGLKETRTAGAGDARTVTAILHTPKGDLTRIKRAPENKPDRITKPFIASDADIERYMSIPYEPPQFDLANARAVQQAAGDAAIVGIMFPDAMDSVSELFDFEDFCFRCVTDLPAVLRFMDWASERCEANMKLLLEAVRGPVPGGERRTDLLLHTCAAENCTPPMMSPALYAKLVTPYLRRLIRLAHDGGMLTALHCHGRVREVFPEILSTGADLLEPIEPPNQGNISIAELMRQARGRICLMGHIQDQEFYTAPPGFMTRRVEEIAKVVRGCTGYIMSPTCTPFQFPCSKIYRRNYLEWLDAAERLLAVA
jgi:hypothetical protein